MHMFMAIPFHFCLCKDVHYYVQVYANYFVSCHYRCYVNSLKWAS